MVLTTQQGAIETTEQGYLHDGRDWCEDFTYKTAERDGIKLYVDHWELIWYFRDFYEANKTHPTMHQIVRTLGKSKGEHFRDQKSYEQHIYSLFPTDPIHELCKLAGLPMPPPDT